MVEKKTKICSCSEIVLHHANGVRKKVKKRTQSSWWIGWTRPRFWAFWPYFDLKKSSNNWNPEVRQGTNNQWQGCGLLQRIVINNASESFDRTMQHYVNGLYYPYYHFPSIGCIKKKKNCPQSIWWLEAVLRCDATIQGMKLFYVSSALTNPTAWLSYCELYFVTLFVSPACELFLHYFLLCPTIPFSLSNFRFPVPAKSFKFKFYLLPVLQKRADHEADLDQWIASKHLLREITIS